MPLAHDLEIGSELGHRLHFLLAYRWGLIIPATGYQEIELLNHVLEVSGYSRYDSHGRNRLCRRTVNRNPTLQTVVIGSMGLSKYKEIIQLGTEFVVFDSRSIRK